MRSLDWVSVVVPSIKREIEFRGRRRWDKVGCIRDKVLSLAQVEVPVEYPVRYKNLKLVGINVEVLRVND